MRNLGSIAVKLLLLGLVVWFVDFIISEWPRINPECPGLLVRTALVVAPLAYLGHYLEKRHG